MSSLTENASALHTELEERLDAITLETDDPLRQPELSIESIQKSLSRLKELVYSHTFSDQNEEIHFFKNTKPNFFSKLIYHVKIYNIEMHKPNGSDKAKRKYLLNELHDIESFFSRNLDFIKYYRTQKTYLDHKYFVRGNHDLSLTLDIFSLKLTRCLAQAIAAQTHSDTKAMARGKSQVENKFQKTCATK